MYFSFYKHYIRDSIHRVNWKANSLASEHLISLVAFILLRPGHKAEFLKNLPSTSLNNNNATRF